MRNQEPRTRNPEPITHMAKGAIHLAEARAQFNRLLADTNITDPVRANLIRIVAAIEAGAELVIDTYGEHLNDTKTIGGMEITKRLQGAAA